MILDYKKHRLDIAGAMRRDKVAIFPTDTIYGIGTIWNSPNNSKIFRIKKRKKDKPLLILSDFKWIDEFADLGGLKEELERYWPGPFTLIINTKICLPWWISDGRSAAFRVPRNRELLELIRAVGAPITATSVNFSGEAPLNDITKIKRIYAKHVDIIAEDDSFVPAKPSKVIDLREISTKRRIR